MNGGFIAEFTPIMKEPTMVSDHSYLALLRNRLLFEKTILQNSIKLLVSLPYKSTLLSLSIILLHVTSINSFVYVSKEKLLRKKNSGISDRVFMF